MKVGSVSEEISSPSQKWTPDGGRDSAFSTIETTKTMIKGLDRVPGDEEEEKSAAAMARPTSGSGARVDGETGRGTPRGTTTTTRTMSARGRHHTTS